MSTHAIRAAWIVSAVLVVSGCLLFLFPQPFITYYCSSYVCPSQVAGGLSIGYIVLGLALVAIVVSGIMSVASVTHRSGSRRTT